MEPFNQSAEWVLLPVLCHRHGVASDLIWNLSVAGFADGRTILEGAQETRALRVGSWPTKRILSEVQIAEVKVYESGAEVRMDEEIIRTIERRVSPLRGRNLGEGLKREANEALYALDVDYAVYLEQDRLVVRTRYRVDQHFELAWVHFFPNEDEPRARQKAGLRLPAIFDVQ